MENYTYNPIEEGGTNDGIRLLYLLPGEPSDEIQCELKNVSLSDEPIYSAVSYCWGRNDHKIEILCNEVQVFVTQNLHSFLVQLRDASEMKPLWVDAICIDQSNIPERSTQVQRMRRIYSAAAQVLIWLGDATDGSDEAVTAAKYIGQLDPRTVNPFLSFSGQGTAPISHKIWCDLCELFDRPYFRRGWIVQEVAVSKRTTVLCGSSSMTWEELYSAAIYLNDSGILQIFNNTTVLEIHAISQSRREQLQSIERHPLCILLRHRKCQVSDLRDYVFAFHGLAERFFSNLRVEPDYSLDAASAYKELAVAILTQDRTLDLLTVPRGPARARSETANLPSWVPDWSHKTNARSLLRLEDQNSPWAFKSTGDTRSDPQFDAESSRLGLEGYVADEIHQISRLISKSYENLDLRSSVSFWAVLARHAQSIKAGVTEWRDIERVIQAHSKKKYVNGDSMIEVYWQTLRGGYVPEGEDEARSLFHKWMRSQRWQKRLYPFSHAFPVYFVYHLAAAAISSFRSFIGVDHPISVPQKDFTRRCNCNERRVFRTKRGCVGLGPADIRVGDRIARCKGGRLPLVIREAGNDWKIVGDCFVHSLNKVDPFDEQKCARMWFV